MGRHTGIGNQEAVPGLLSLDLPYSPHQARLSDNSFRFTFMAAVHMISMMLAADRPAFLGHTLSRSVPGC